ncbi:MAG: HypC/HybG/HupF family hydrogenase formation chaperone [Propionibacteriaceae bacterium]|jgi:hydrogenase expression/formation protein HypC|nr:HypC/HybG/HupF family hydrogenase formation chaperone [Propionibacteriaceae bacterium]
MCLGIPGEVVELLGGDLATVSVSGVRRDISVGLLDGVAVGDWVLVHVGFALSKVDEKEAALTLEQVRKLGRVWDEEMDAYSETDIR